MIRTSLMLVAGLLSLAFFRASPLAANGLLGSPAPYFSVESGDGEEFNLDMIKGRVTAVFYENREIVDGNKRLKDELNELYYAQTGIVKDMLVRLPVIDCSDAVLLFRGMWKRNLREHSRKEGMTIYCDWKGQMATDYKMKADVSNVVIIDKSARIRFYRSGEVDAEEINGVKELLIALARE